MSRKSKIDPVEKVKMVERYLNGEVGVTQAAKLATVNHKSFQAWIVLYKAEGPAGLLNQYRNRNYSKEFKMKTVNEYLSSGSSLLNICEKYNIRSKAQLSAWIKVYNTGGTFKESTGGAYMKKSRTMSSIERIQIVKDCLTNDKNYGAMAIKYNCSYQQVRNWVIKYEGMGSKGLEDRRGHRAGSLPSRSLEEEFRDKISELERKNQDLQMENNLLKKVRELERRDRYL